MMTMMMVLTDVVVPHWSWEEEEDVLLSRCREDVVRQGVPDWGMIYSVACLKINKLAAREFLGILHHNGGFAFFSQAEPDT